MGAGQGRSRRANSAVVAEYEPIVMEARSLGVGARISHDERGSGQVVREELTSIGRVLCSVRFDDGTALHGIRSKNINKEEGAGVPARKLLGRIVTVPVTMLTASARSNLSGVKSETEELEAQVVIGTYGDDKPHSPQDKLSLSLCFYGNGGAIVNGFDADKVAPLASFAELRVDAEPVVF